MRDVAGREFFSIVMCLGIVTAAMADDNLLSPSRVRKFVDDLPDMRRIRGYQLSGGAPAAASLKIGMYLKQWKFSKDLPPTPVFAYGPSHGEATVPGPTIEAVQRVSTFVTWQNHLPRTHILPFDRTISTARSRAGVPTVVHLHGAIDAPQNDGNPEAWFTSAFRTVGSKWTRKKYHYRNEQQPGTLWYHDHAMGLTRVNLLAGLTGSYIIRDNQSESLGLPSGDELDRPLMIFGRAFYANGSLYMNQTGNNPDIHPQWQPEYFGDVIVVNGKAWPRLIVRRRRYRFRIINASNARFFRLFFTNGLRFIHVASDSAYLPRPVVTNSTLLAPSEIADVVIDFSESKTQFVILSNDAPYPYPSGDPVNSENSKVMKFIIKEEKELDSVSSFPSELVNYPSPDISIASRTRYIAMYEYTSVTGEPTHLLLNAKSYDSPATEIVKVGSTEIWNIINLTEDNHPLHIHLALFAALNQTELVKIDEFRACMKRKNDAVKCNVSYFARGRTVVVPAEEKGWKNVFKMKPGFMTTVLARFALIHSNASYSFDATAEPGYVYHCHILDHEDNTMMRPLKLTN